MTGLGGKASPGEVLFKFTRLGQQMRVAAIEAASGIEVVVIAPVSATPLQMQDLAPAKLKRRLADIPVPPPPRRF